MTDIIYGLHVLQTVAERAPQRLMQVFVLQGRDDKRLIQLLNILHQQGIAVHTASRQWLDEQAAGGSHQGVLAQVKAAPVYQENDLAGIIHSTAMPLLLVLDGVTDPHNLGACLRNADAAGAHALIVPKDRSAALNATAKKVACGAAETVPLIRVTNLARTLRYLQQQRLWIVGTADQASQPLWQSDLNGALALVMGAEGEGMRRLTREHCDQLISIPMAGAVSSLNVSVASGICLFEALRQRTQPGKNSA